MARAKNPSSGTRLYYLALAVLILLNLGKAVLLIGAGQPSLEHDSRSYWNLGTQFSHGDWLLREHPMAHRPPAYPAYLGLMIAAFGEHGMVAATIGQHLLVFATALMTGWLCAKVTRSRAGMLAGLVLSLICVSRSCFAVFLMADNMLCMTLLLYLAFLLAWLARPSYWTAAAVGALIGLSILVKPAAQMLWLSTLALMAYKLWTLSSLRQIWKHAIVCLAAMSALLTPWYIRNKACFGEYFFVQFIGRALWDSTYQDPHNKLPLLPSNGPNTCRFLREVQPTGVDVTWTGSVFSTLRKLGYSEIDSDRIMQKVALESIKANLGKVALARLLRSGWFWLTPKAFTIKYPWGEFYSTGAAIPSEASVAGQKRWFSPLLLAANNAFLSTLWHPRWYFFALAALAAHIGCLLMILDPDCRDAGLAIASLLLLFSLTVVGVGCPEYQFRMILEPAMIVAVTAGLMSWYRRRGADSALGPTSSSDRAIATT